MIKTDVQTTSVFPAQTVARYSLLRSAPAFIILAIAIGCANNFADPDLWMHIVAGERILHTGHIPLHDLYSYSAAGLPWRNHEWLAQVILAASYDALGVFGLKMVKLLCTTLMVVGLAVGFGYTGAPMRIQRILLIAAAAGAVGMIQLRPQLFTFAMLSLLMMVLAGEIYLPRTRLWPLIPMFALWANLHGGFLAGLGALVIVTVMVALQELLAERKLDRTYHIAAITLGCALATLLNPLGVALWSNVIHSMSDPVVKSFIRDWLPLLRYIAYNWGSSKLDDVQYAMPIVLFVAFVFALVAAPRLEDASLVAVALVFISAAFYSSRNIALAVISLSIPFAYHVGLALERRSLPNNERSAQTGPGPVFVTAAALMIALAAGEFSNRLKTWEPVPAGAVGFMKDHRLNGNILNDLGWGAYLVWHRAPQSRIFVDGRCELVYPDSMLREYLGFLFGWPGGERVLDRYPHDFVLVKPGSGAYRIVAADPRWKPVYRDSVSVLFAKAGTPVRAQDARSPVAAASSFP